MPYKKLIAILMMLALCLSICGCSNQSATPAPTATPTPTASPTPEPLPLMKHYENATDLGFDIFKIGDIRITLEALRCNPDIHHFFTQEGTGTTIWQFLSQQCSYSDIYCMYAVCNGNSRWFDALNIHGTPFELYSRGTPYESDSIPSKESIINQIKDNFKDPYSVSIPGDMLLFLPQAGNVGTMFPSSFEYALWVGVRATNSFGGYGMEGIWIKFSNGKVTFYDSIAQDSEPKDCSLKGFEDTFIRISE